jgi:hypothetical protein
MLTHWAALLPSEPAICPLVLGALSAMTPTRRHLHLPAEHSCHPPPSALAHDPPGSNKQLHSASSQSPTVFFLHIPGQQPALPNRSGKPSLLSLSQKKANHTQSEQKRKVNLRRACEKLCETVPALREAIREEEEAMAEGGSDNRASRANGKGHRKRGRGWFEE